jgi:hypothetical protein
MSLGVSPRPTHKDRLRIVCHLPVNDDAEEAAVGGVFEYLKNLRAQPYLSVDMFVNSQLSPPVYVGYSWSAGHQQWVRNRFVVCIVDYSLSEIANPFSKVSELRENIRGIYRFYTGQSEETFWLVAHTVTRHE